MKLLNEYQKKLNRREENKRNYEIYERELKDDNIRMNDLDDPYEWLNMYWWYAKARLISKQFWFIKRLVENDKIDLSNEEYFYQDTIYELEQAQLIKDLSDYLIMKLSISDNPIEDLISYLR